MQTRSIAMLVLLVGLVTPARAHEDPAGCFETGPAIVVRVFRSDGVTEVIGSVGSCEQIFYRARLQKATDSDTICAFSAGIFTLTTPDGVVHTIDSNVPCIGGDGPGEGCDPTRDFLESDLIPYSVSPADVVSGLITATSAYIGGVAHDTVGNTPGVGAETPKSTPVTNCPTTTTTSTTVPTTSSTTLPPKSACSSRKFSIASKLGAALTKCRAKALKTGKVEPPDCRTKAFAKFDEKWEQAETISDCLTTADIATVRTLADGCVDALTDELMP